MNNIIWSQHSLRQIALVEKSLLLLAIGRPLSPRKSLYDLPFSFPYNQTQSVLGGFASLNLFVASFWDRRHPRRKNSASSVRPFSVGHRLEYQPHEVGI